MWENVLISVNTEGCKCTLSALESQGSIFREKDFTKQEGVWKMGGS